MPKMIPAFLDANIYLSMYQYSGEDLEQMEKLQEYVRIERVKLYLTDQVSHEVRRRRNEVFNLAVETLQKVVTSTKLPSMCSQYAKECEDFEKAATAYNRAKGALVKRLQEDFENRTLKVDQLIANLFRQATTIKADDEIIKAARFRKDRGNPPGKANHLGDEINWECLLKGVEGDLYLVADDSDYRARGSQDTLSPYLKWEWEANGASNITYYKTLSLFVLGELPDIKLATEQSKDDCIETLLAAKSFREAKKVLSKLRRLGDFNAEQIETIAETFLANNQVYWIAEDPEVQSFIAEVIMPRFYVLDPALAARFTKAFLTPTKEPGDTGPTSA